MSAALIVLTLAFSPAIALFALSVAKRVFHKHSWTDNNGYACSGCHARRCLIWETRDRRCRSEGSVPVITNRAGMTWVVCKKHAKEYGDRLRFK